jgi:hypothetical protein
MGVERETDVVNSGAGADGFQLVGLRIVFSRFSEVFSRITQRGSAATEEKERWVPTEHTEYTECRLVSVCSVCSVGQRIEWIEKFFVPNVRRKTRFSGITV